MVKRKPTIDLTPLVDEAIAKVQSIDSVGHMFYVKQRMEEAIVLLQALKSQISDA